MRHILIVTLALLLAGSGLTACETSESGSKTEANGESQATSENAAPPEEESEGSAADEAADNAEDNAAEEDATSEGDEAGIELGLPSQARPMDGVITAGQPSKEQFEKLDDAGVKHVINLRTSAEAGTWDEATKAEEMGLSYTNIPVASPSDLSRENVEAFDKALASAEGDVLVHCGSSNRVGAMFALRAFWIQGEGIDQAIEIGKKAGMSSLEAAVREKIE